MKCPVCQADFINPKFYNGYNGEAIVIEVEDVVYNRERPVTGYMHKHPITTYDYDRVDNDTVISAVYQCNGCGYELSATDVAQAVKEWEETE